MDLEKSKTGCVILHLEDDDNDSLFFERALAGLRFSGAYRHVATIQETLDYLNGAGIYADGEAFPRPTLLLIDNTLGSQKLIAWLRREEKFRALRLIMLTGGIRDEDAEKWLARGIEQILPKGGSLEEMTLSAQNILDSCGG